MTLRRYKLLRGYHIDEKQVPHAPGDKFWSSQDLLKLNASNSRKFELLPDQPKEEQAAPSAQEPFKAEEPPKVEPVPGLALDDMNLEQLRAFAQEEGIDLGRLTNLDKIRQTIREAMED